MRWKVFENVVSAQKYLKIHIQITADVVVAKYIVIVNLLVSEAGQIFAD